MLSDVWFPCGLGRIVRFLVLYLHPVLFQQATRLLQRSNPIGQLNQRTLATLREINLANVGGHCQFSSCIKVVLYAGPRYQIRASNNHAGT